MTKQNFEQTAWSLDALLPARKGPELDQILAELEQHVAQFEASRERLLPDIGDDEFLELMRLYETIYLAASRVNAYAYLWFAEDTQ